jgi:hypothetical protein
MAAVVAAVMSTKNNIKNNEPSPAQGSKARAEKHEREMKMRAKTDAILSNVSKVNAIRQKVKNNQVVNLDTEEGKRAAAAWRIQLFARSWKHRGVKCHRENLGARLVFEDELKIGVWRLLTQVCGMQSLCSVTVNTSVISQRLRFSLLPQSIVLAPLQHAAYACYARICDMSLAVSQSGSFASSVC